VALDRGDIGLARTALEKTSAKTLFRGYGFGFFSTSATTLKLNALASRPGRAKAMPINGLPDCGRQWPPGTGDVEKMRSYLFQHVRLMNQHRRRAGPKCTFDCRSYRCCFGRKKKR